MSETKETKTAEETETEETETEETETEIPSGFEQLENINWDTVRRAILSVKGQNPDVEQTITDFMDMSDPVEGSNLPTRRDVQLIVYLDMCSSFLFPDNPKNPFATLRNAIAKSLKARKGEKAKQFVEMVRNQPDLSQLAAASEESKQGIIAKIFGSGTE